MSSETDDQALKALGLDDYQRIAASEILRDLENLDWPPAPGSEHERKLIQLGAIVSERWNIGPPDPEDT